MQFAIYEAGDRSVGIWDIDREGLMLSEVMKYVADGYTLETDEDMDAFAVHVQSIVDLPVAERGSDAYVESGDMRIWKTRG